MYSVRLSIPEESLEEWGKRCKLSKARRRRIEEIVLGKEGAARLRAREAAGKASSTAGRRRWKK